MSQVYLRWGIPSLVNPQSIRTFLANVPKLFLEETLSSLPGHETNIPSYLEEDTVSIFKGDLLCSHPFKIVWK